MEILENHNKLSDKRFQREVGTSRDIFIIILRKITAYITEQKQRNRLRQRGLKNGISIANRLLITMLYMRQHHTFSQIALMFDISEGSANKLYHQIARILPKVLQTPDNKKLMDTKSIAIDASEQAIERP